MPLVLGILTFGPVTALYWIILGRWAEEPSSKERGPNSRPVL